MQSTTVNRKEKENQGAQVIVHQEQKLAAAACTSANQALKLKRKCIKKTTSHKNEFEILLVDNSEGDCD
jgi:hypothetical protein